MARRFRKKAGLGAVCLPGLPGLGNDTIVEGDQYAKFFPAILEEVFDAPATKPATQKVVVKVSPPAPPKPEPEEEDDEPDPEPEDDEPEDDGEVEPPNMDWLKSELVEYAKGLDLAVDGRTMTKAQILDAIEAEEGE